MYLELNGYCFEASEEDAAQAMLNRAAGQYAESDYAAFLRAQTRRRR
jgi:prophage maintenance system killer protein